MFEIGWTEMLVIAIVMIVVVGPKDLPKMLRTFGKTVAKLRGMAGDFQKQFNEALKEAELDGVKQSIDDIRGLNPVNDIKKQLNPFEKAAADVRAGLDKALKPSTASEPASPVAHPAEPLKTGATAMPAAPETIVSLPPDLASTAATPVSAPVDGPAPSADATKARAPKGDVNALASASPPAAARQPRKPSAAASGSKAASTKPVAPKPEVVAAADVTAAVRPVAAKARTQKSVAEKAPKPAAAKADPAVAARAKPGAVNGAHRSGRAK